MPTLSGNVRFQGETGSDLRVVRMTRLTHFGPRRFLCGHGMWCSATQGTGAKMKCLRVHSTADGESHFDEVEIPTTSRQVHPNAAAFEGSAKNAGTGIRYRTFRRVRDRSIGIAVAPIAGPYGVRAVATDALISGNGFGSLRRSLKSSTTDRS